MPLQLAVIKKRSRRRVAEFSAQYISFYNCLWLILNDVIVGTAVGVFLCENNQELGYALRKYTKILSVDIIHGTLIWLDNWPAGLKLNTELSRFFCLSFMGLTDLWARCLAIITPHFPLIVYFIGLSGYSGMTMILSLLSDLLSILSVHVYVSYLIATFIFSQQLFTARSLFNLFRGKRKNVLRNRIDSWDYDLDQLLLGTILFTLITFLFPTILVYYTLFALMRLAIIFAHATLETFLAFTNHFPLFAMMLRLKDPSRLPGGIYFVHQKIGNSRRWVIKNLPIPFSRIFFQHLRVWSKLSAHYDPLRLLRCFLTGTFITPIPRYSIRYNMIPERRDSVSVSASASKESKVE
ncbi:hypothetical protein BOTBODRAFT_611370 [Botryobasidium botryosum FD-172 SS1]|uniref:Gpi1-domain-containing protein n=1 Tax=Botryobasidium botryosum (strain FD-172 SS1) TaxID=930990 RepID=A0A067LVK9_BOTB1|nr:hypothetical protein BOTBODRAFT_611370 [Botryobasidium botryosum FD-172 SS1]